MLDNLSKLSAWRDYARFGIDVTWRNDQAYTKHRGDTRYRGIARVESLEHVYPNGARGVAHKLYIGTTHVDTMFDSDWRVN